MSKIKLDEKRDEHKKEFRKEMSKFVELFMVFRYQQSWNKARNYIELLKREINVFPEFLRTYIIENFMPIYKKYILFLHDDIRGKLDPTNNKVENYFGNTLPRRIKNIFRTKSCAFNFICNRKNGWVENNKSALTN